MHGQQNIKVFKAHFKRRSQQTANVSLTSTDLLVFVIRSKFLTVCYVSAAQPFKLGINGKYNTVQNKV